MRHFIDNKGQPATVKFVDTVERVFGGNLLMDYERCLELHRSGSAEIEEIRVDSFRRGSIWLKQPSKSPWAGFWVCHNFNKERWIQLSKGRTEQDAVSRYESGLFDREKGVYKNSPMTEKRLLNAIKCNEAQQIKHYGTTTLEFIETLPEDIAAKVKRSDQ